MYLRVKGSGAKSWVLRVVINGRRSDYGLGPYPIVTIEEAREKAFDRRRAIYHGKHEVAIKVPTFGEAIDGALPAMPKVKEHHKALSYRDVPEAMKVIGSRVSAARLCIRFLILTATRSNEAREATWSEIDRETATWVIPAKRMKDGSPHRVPLTETALAALDEAEQLRDGSDLIFPSPTKPGKAMTADNLMKVWRKTGIAGDTTIHGFRTSFRTWAAERTDIPREFCEMALAHAVGNAVEQAYSRSDLLEKRVALMQQWGEYLNGE